MMLRVQNSLNGARICYSSFGKALDTKLSLLKITISHRLKIINFLWVFLKYTLKSASPLTGKYLCPCIFFLAKKLMPYYR